MSNGICRSTEDERRRVVLQWSPTMTISQFYEEVLGANLANSRWSWGAVDPVANRVYLRVWKDELEPNADGAQRRRAARCVLGNYGNGDAGQILKAGHRPDAETASHG